MVKVRVIPLLTFCIVLQYYTMALWALNKSSQRPKVENVVFYTEDSIRLSGLLCLPPNVSPKKIVVYIPPLKEYDNLIVPMVNHGDTTSFLGKMLSLLIESDVGFFTFSMRYPCNSGDFHNDFKIMKSKPYRSQTLHTLAIDAVNAYHFLKEEKRFVDIPVGVAGTSAMGRAAAMAAVKCTEFSFSVLFSTPSTDNFDEAELDYERGSLNYIHLKEGYFSVLWDMLADTTFTYRNKKYSSQNPSIIKNQFVDCAWDCFNRINRSIIANYENYDTIQYKATSLMKESFSLDSIKFKNKVENMMAKNPKELIDTIMWYWHKPIDISFLKWNAEEWYSKLNCPTLIFFAGKDKIIDSLGSYNNLLSIKDRYNKTNFEITLIDEVDHAFKSVQNGRVEQSVFKKMLCWLDTIK